MAEADRALWLAADVKGGVLPPDTRLCLLLLWSLVRAADAAAYRAGGVPPTTVPFRKRDLVSHLGQSARSIERHLERLRDAGWIVGGPTEIGSEVHQYKVHAVHDRRSWIQVNGASSSATSEVADEIPDSSVGPPPDPTVGDRRPQCRPPPTLRSDPPDTAVGGSTRSSLTIVGNAPPSSLIAPPSPAGARGGGDPLLAEALEILREAIPPAGCAAIPATVHGARHLVAQLAGGLSSTLARELLADAPGIVEAGLRDADRYNAEMWDGERFSRWLQAQAAYRRRKAATPPPLPSVQPPTPAEQRRRLAVLDESSWGGQPS